MNCLTAWTTYERLGLWEMSFSVSQRACVPFFLRASGWLGMCIDSAPIPVEGCSAKVEAVEGGGEREVGSGEGWPVGVERSGRREPRGHSLHPLNVLRISGSVLPKFQRNTSDLLSPKNPCLRPLIESQYISKLSGWFFINTPVAFI